MSDGSDSNRAQERSDRPQRPPAPTSSNSQSRPKGYGSRQAALTGRKNFDTLASAAFDRHPHRRSGTVLPQPGGKPPPTAAAPFARSLSKPASNPSREEGASVGGPSSAQGADNDGDVVGVSEPTRSAEKTIGQPVNVQRLVQDLGTPRGMLNFGNTCFMASVLQVLIRVSPLARYLLEEVDAQGVGGRPTGSLPDLMDAMMDLAKEVHRTTRTDAIRPTVFHDSMSLFIMGYKGNTQQDASEYLTKLIEGIAGCCSGRTRPGEPDVVSQLFSGRYQSQLTCKTCEYVSKKNNVVKILNLEMPPGIDSLDGILQNYTKKEDLLAGNRWECHNCNTKRDTIKRTTIEEPPNVLVATLSRFQYMDEGGIVQKITAHISFDTELQLQVSDTEEFCLYDLSGVIVHEGPTAFSGHYVSYVKTSTDTWALMNDEEASQVTWAEVRRQQVYAFVYTRREMELPASVSSLAPPSAAAAAASAVATGGKTADATSSVGCGISSRGDRACAETSDGVPSDGATAPVVGSIGKRGREGGEGEGEGEGESSADVGPFAPEHREGVSANTPAVPLQPTKRQRLGVCERDVESRGSSEGRRAEGDSAARLVAEALLQLSSPWNGPVVTSLQQAREPSVTTPERQAEAKAEATAPDDNCRDGSPKKRVRDKAEATAPDDNCRDGSPKKRVRDEVDEIGGGVERAGGAAGCQITKRSRPSAPTPGANS